MFAHRSGNLFFGGARNEADEASEGASHEGSGYSESNGASNGRQRRSKVGAEPETSFEADGQKPDRGKASEEHRASKRELRPRHSANGALKAGTKSGDETSRLLTHRTGGRYAKGPWNESVPAP